MLPFLLGVLATIIAAIVLFITLPLLWLLSGGDFEGNHWLFDGDGSIIQRWRWREYNGRNPHRPS